MVLEKAVEQFLINRINVVDMGDLMKMEDVQDLHDMEGASLLVILNVNCQIYWKCTC